MDSLTQEKIEDLARRYGVSTEAVSTLAKAVKAGNGNMAQFSHPDLGGLGQWSRGGMTMVGDMFNNALKDKVDGLASELAGFASLPGDAGKREQSDDWWGADLGPTTAAGSQNDIRYAYFSGSHRLAIQSGGKVTIYDTEDHQIGGVSQQQSGGSSLTFTSQHGPVRVADLRVTPEADPSAA